MMEVNSVYHGNNIDVLKRFPDTSIDLTVTSPPYDDLRSYQGVSWNFDIFKLIATELYRITKKGGVVVWVVGDATLNGSESGTSFLQALFFKELGFNLHDTMIFEKNTSSFPASRGGYRYTQIFEYMFIFSKGKPKTAHLICDKENRWAGYKNFGKNTNRTKNDQLVESSDIKTVPKTSPRNNIWRYNVNFGYSTKEREAHKHPAIFPEELAKDHILSWSNEGDVVLDPFAGSGTTLKMAKLNNRKYIGVEVTDEYIDIIRNRESLRNECKILRISDAECSTGHSPV